MTTYIKRPKKEEMDKRQLAYGDKDHILINDFKGYGKIYGKG